MKMTFNRYVFTLICVLISLKVAAIPRAASARSDKAPLTFVENKGQVTDQNLQPRSDVQFSLHAMGGLNIFIGCGAIHYQFSKLASAQASAGQPVLAQPEKSAHGIIYKAKNSVAASSDFVLDRIDVELVGANPHAKVITEEAQAYYENHINPENIDRKGEMAHSFNRITYQDIYPGIDWVLYISNGQLEHEFVVRKEGSYADIKLKYGGATALKMNSDGSLSAETPQGMITEKAPVSLLEDGSKVNSSFVLQGNILTYQVDNFTGALIIDPSVVWATYFGGTADDEVGGLRGDGSGNLYMVGWTNSTAAIATTGAYHTTFSGGFDVFLTKFNSAGAMQWATYYGGSDTDQAEGLAVDAFGNVFVGGQTRSSSGIATTGAYQSAIGGDYDAFIAEFNSSGALQWASYVGGPNFDEGVGLVTDGGGNVYMTGTTTSATGISLTGAWQPTLTGAQNSFLIKFSGAGIPQFSTYFGGEGNDVGNSLAADASGNIFLAGLTSSTTGIATTGAHQIINAGGSFDVFLAKFSSAGLLNWGTYYGGSGDDEGNGVAIDASGNIIITGLTSSLGTIASTGAYQTSLAGFYDAFVAKFNTAGVIQWGTYYGGTGYDGGGAVTTDALGNIYVTGSTASASGIATSGAVQPAYGGGSYDGFVVEFSSAGFPQFGTYYGGSANDLCSGVVCDGSGNVFIAGSTGSSSSISTSGSHQPAFGGGANDGFLAQINICSLPVVSPLTGPGAVCQGASISLGEVTSGGTWSASTAIATVGTTGTVTGVNAGAVTISYTVTNICGTTAAVKVVTVNAIPTVITVTPASSATVCLGSGAPFTAASNGLNLLVYQDFNSGMTGEVGGTWSVTNLADVSPYNWSIITPTTYTDVLTYSGTALTGDGTPCAGTNADLAGGSSHLSTQLISPAFSTVGYSSVSLSFNYYCWSAAPYDATAAIEYSIDGGATWGTVYSYLNTNTGAHSWSAGVPTQILLLPSAALGQPSVMVRWNYISNFGYFWAVDNINISGGTTPAYTWTGIAGATGLSCSSCATTTITPVASGVNSYSVVATTNGCAAGSSVVVSVNPLPAMPAMITGATKVCVGSSVTLLDGTPTGSWSSTLPGVASIGSSSGILTALSVGVTTISYTVTNSCGSTAATRFDTVVSAPGAISGVLSACVGATSLLSDGGGGNWSSSNPGVASVGSTSGLVTANSPGNTTITYSLGGTCTVTAIFTVNANPASITPAGAVSICVGATASLGDGTPSGNWSSQAAGTAIVGTSGIVTGVSAGAVNISYTTSAGCSAIKAVTVLVTPAALSPASAAICPGSTVTFSESVGGGTWGSTAPAVAGVAAGVVTGASSGNTNISYTIGACAVGAPVTVNTAPAAITPAGAVTMCVGGTALLSDGTPSGTWSSIAPGIATVGTSGLVTGITAGATNISYTTGLGCSAVKSVTVMPTPTAIFPSSAVLCTGNTVTLTESVGGGTWSSTAPGIASVAGAVVTGVTVGTASISYTIGTCAAGIPVTVNPSPNAGVISGPAVLCAGSSFTYTDAAPGGAWGSSNPAVASAGVSGLVTGITAGSVLISYAVTNSCGTATATLPVTINSAASAGTIIGTTLVCAGSFTTYIDTTFGGTWSVTNSHATISGSGLLVGISPGIDTVLYTVSNSCGTISAMKIITIGLPLSAGAITGPSSVCAGAAITLTDPVSGGAWSTSNTSASVSGGTVTGIAGGVDTIMYTVTSGCGSVSAIQVVTVIPVPAAGTISGPVIVCAGSITTFTDAAPGGVWGVTNSLASISGGGVVAAFTPGADTITYTVSNTCGSATTSLAVSIGAAFSAGSISGPGVVCVGAAITLSDPVPGGAWSASNTHATLISGLVTGFSAGFDTISYTVTGSCGSVSATAIILVNPLPLAGVVSGAGSLCIGSPSTYTDAALGGTWSMSNGLAVISSGGVATPITLGSDTVLYTVTNSCGTAQAAMVVNILGALTAGSIAGPSFVCAGATITLTDGVSGGAWAASNGNATVVSGLITGVAPGADTISYTVSGSCGTAVASVVVTVDMAPFAGAISGPSTVCAGAPITLSDPAPGGAWSASNTNATVSTSGVVTAISPGADTISYTVTNGCGSVSATYNVLASTMVPSAGSISGPSTVCTGSSVLLSDPVPGGIWSSSNASATVSGGVVTGIAPGTDTIIYQITNACGTATASAIITIGAALTTGTIAGPAGVCVGSSITLSDPVGGGSWSSVNTHASVIGGVVTGLTVGIDTIYYTVTGTCGTAAAVKLVSVNLAPDAGAITGSASVCAGSAIILADAAGGGVWSASNSRASVSATGVVTGVLSGSDTIKYTVTNSCGTAVATHTVAIGAAPSAGSITGANSLCPGAVVHLSHSVSGGVWGSSNTGVASVDGSGTVAGVSPGIVTISYTVTNGCGHSTAVFTVTVLAPGDCEGTLVGGPASTKQEELFVYPNPNNGKCTVKLVSAASEPVHVLIFNVLGQKVDEFDSVTNKLIDLQIFQATGIYLLNATTVNGSYVARVIVN